MKRSRLSRKGTKTLKKRLKVYKMIYPEEMTVTHADRFPVFKSFEDLSKALAYEKKHGGKLYTQIDIEGKAEDGNDIVYLRGSHLVNRTGLWIVVKANQKQLSAIMDEPVFPERW
jgi:hypothetical protein